MNAPMRAKSPVARLVDLLLTDDVALRPTLLLCLVAFGIYVGWVATLWLYLVPSGMITLNWARVFVCFHVVALAFYPLVRSGLTRHRPDPGLVAVQMLWANLVLAVGYAAVPSVRPAMLQTAVLIQVFGFVNLRPRSAVWVGTATIGVLASMLVVMSAVHPAEFNVRTHALRIGSTCFVIGLLTWQSRNFALARQRLGRERRELASALEQVQQVAQRDALTGLFNRQHLESRIEIQAQRAQRSGEGFSLALIDLDHFKRINDTHGHHAGDQVLIAFARTAQNVLRASDLIGRWGGEEFVIVMPAADPAQMAQIGLDRLRADLTQPGQVVAQSGELTVTFSAGVAAWRPDESVSELLRRADAALYQAKAQGRNRSVTAA